MQSKETRTTISRRTALSKGAQALAGIAVVVCAARPAWSKGKASKEDFYFQDTPGDEGRTCTGCINFTPKSTGDYGKDSGDCALLAGDVCTHCYCQGWTDKNDPNAKKAS
jgi:hypothetical protein